MSNVFKKDYMFAGDNKKSKTYAHYLYEIKPFLKQDYSNLNQKKKIFVCCFNIQSNEGFDSSLYHLMGHKKENVPDAKELPSFFLLYLLYKYPENDLMIFPFAENKNNPLNTANNLVKKLLKTNKSYKAEGYIMNNDGIYFFYDISYHIELNKPLKREEQLWHCLIDEICNANKVLNFPVHKSVFSLFYNNPFLIYLKFKKQKLSIPVVGYEGVPYSDLGIKLAIDTQVHPTAFGWFPLLSRFNDSFLKAIWLRYGGIKSNVEYLQRWKQFHYRKHAGKENEYDDFGRYKKYGGIIRFVCFLGKKRWHVLYQKNDPFFKVIEGWDIKDDNLKILQKYRDIKDHIKTKWPKFLDSIIIGKIKLKHLGFNWKNSFETILRKSSQRIPLSFSMINTKNVPNFWDPEHKYNIA